MENHAEVKEGTLVPDLFFKKEKTFYEVKASFGRPLFEHTIKVNCIKFQIFDPEIWSILILQNRFHINFVFGFLRKIFFMLPLLLEILVKLCIANI